MHFPHVGIIDAPADSLFSYQPGESWATYYDPFFVPFYEPVFASPALEAQANEMCGDDTFCLFDIAATSRVEIGTSTLEGGQEFDEIANFSVPGKFIVLYYRQGVAERFIMSTVALLGILYG